jgi:voltage-gated potassium channel Kch
MHLYNLKRLRLAVLASGLLALLFGVALIISPPLYFFLHLGENLTYTGRVISIFTIFAGLLIIWIAVRFNERTANSWRALVVLIFLVTSIFIYGGFIFFYPTLIVIAFNVVLLAFLVMARKEFRYPSVPFFSPESIGALVTIGFTISYGVGGVLLLGSQFSPHITNIVNALYFTGETVTTLGFGDILPVTAVSRLFTISLVILGIASFFGAMVILVTPLIERRIGGIVNVMKRHQIQSLKDYTLVCGYSETLMNYLTDLKGKGELVVFMEEDKIQSEKLINSGFVVIDERPDSQEALLEFNFAVARRVVIGSRDDGHNILVAAALYQVPAQENLRNKVIVMIQNSSNAGRFSIFNYKIIDVSAVIGDYLLGLTE